MGVCLSDPPSENLIKGAARENSAAWRCRLFAQISILPIFLSTMTSRVAEIWKVGRGKEIAWEDVFELDRMVRRFLLGKQRDEYLFKNLWSCDKWWPLCCLDSLQYQKMVKIVV